LLNQNKPLNRALDEKSLRNAFIPRLPYQLGKSERKNMKKAITGIMLAVMAISIVSLVPNISGADSETQGVWVRMNGNITQWNKTDGTSTPTFGWIVANAAIINKNGTIHEWAMVHATWSDIMRAYPMGEHPLGDVNITDAGDAEDCHNHTWTGNFSMTFSFYTAKLLNLTELSFNKTETGHDFYLTGFWNVSEITEMINITWSTSWSDSWSQYERQVTITTTETPIAINKTGELTADWGVVTFPEPNVRPGPIGVGTFVLSIDGVGPLSGFAWKSFIWARELNPCDFDGQGAVGIKDLVKAAQHFGEAPGFGSYDPSLDVNGEGQIGIGDLTTIAANIQG
jgi:hypothetical protein